MIPKKSKGEIIDNACRKIYIQQKTFAIAKKKANQEKGES
jgi:hypothetical protein